MSLLLQTLNYIPNNTFPQKTLYIISYKNAEIFRQFTAQLWLPCKCVHFCAYDISIKYTPAPLVGAGETASSHAA